MHPEHRFGLELAEKAFFQHQLRAAFFAGRRTFLGGLKNEDNGAGKLFAQGSENRSHAENGSDVNVVTAGVGDSDILAVVGGAYRGLKRQRISSVTGSASSSDRTATTGPGLAPFRIPTTPVCAIPVWTSSPRPASRSATSFEVSNSRFESSGCS